MTTRKLKKRLLANYGRVPSPHYFAGDMDSIRSYYDYRRENDRDAVLLDEITWHDLDMDRVFKRINPSRCTSGEQYLYYMLRSPALDEKTYLERESLIRLAESDGKRRLKMELVLARLGCSRRADLASAFHPSSHGVGMLLVYLALLGLFLAAAVCAAINPARGVPLLAGLILLNALVHEFGKRRCQRDFDTVNYTVNMVFALQRLRKMHDGELDAHLAGAYESLDALRAVLRTGGVSNAMDSGGMGDVLVTITLLDLIAYEYLKGKLGRCHRDVFTVHEHLGKLDAAIAVASYRESLSCPWTLPEIDFRSGAGGVEAADMVHPLLKTAVPNDLVTSRPLLITGSNASGKSTYLKTAALTVILAQSICTALSSSYRAGAFRVYSSMALSDDLLSGESYYIVEIRSIKRILDAAAEEGAPVLCVVDEVLRGTNTVERIAASSEVLHALAEDGVLCLAATHDIELCDLLPSYRLFHFEEQMGEEEMLFDYRLRDGRATSRNAIDLLRLMGFPEAIVENAHARANAYMDRGSWMLLPPDKAE